jgi:hypothetical protein
MFSMTAPHLTNTRRLTPYPSVGLAANQDVLHIPTSHSNLISGPLLAEAGVTAVLTRDVITLLAGETKVVSGKLLHGMYQLDMNIIRLVQSSPAAAQLCDAAPTAAVTKYGQGDFYIA